MLDSIIDAITSTDAATPIPHSPITNVAWDSPLWQPVAITPHADLWLIKQIDRRRDEHRCEDQDDHCGALYLQIATGQWCSASRATKFPSRRSAIAYAREYGLKIGKTAHIVRPTEAIAYQSSIH